MAVDDVDESEEIIREFLVESYENLDQLDQDLVALERDPDAVPLLQSIFRTIHTIKGTSGFLAFSQLEAITHAGEGLLSKLRDGGLALTHERATALLELVDAVRAILSAIETTGSEDDRNHATLISTLTALQAPDAPSAPPKAVTSPPAKARIPAPAKTKVPAPAKAATPAPPQTESGASLIGEILVEQAAVVEDDVTVAVMEQTLGDSRALGEILLDNGQVTSAQVIDALAAQSEARSSQLGDSTIRVDVNLLDTLMREVGELVLARNQISATAATFADPGMIRPSQRLSLIVSELQASVMKTRMQPIDAVWNKLPRVVRDLAVQCGRQVRLEMDGRDTELDKTILEAIKDPLTHIVRNAVDHGIETPAERLAHGKTAEGLLSLRAFHEGGQVNIEIRDDGAGIDPAKIAAKALERGLITAEQARTMSPNELTNLIFLPGLSTAAAVTNVSGRGVGMDVVRTNIEKIGGAVDVTSVHGVGTTMRIKIPLTLAIIPALIIECAGDRYIVPQVSIEELVCLDGGPGRAQVEYLSGAPVLRLRGNLVPLVWLDNVLQLAEKVHVDDEVFILMVQADGRRFGLVVDRILNTEEVVVKPLSSRLLGIGAYAGTTILGDGRVALILDVRTLARRAHVIREGDSADARPPDHVVDLTNAAERLLIVSVGERRLGVPLAMVTRLEDIPLDKIERSGQREVVQYRSQLLTLIRLTSVLGVESNADRDQNLKVIVFCRGNHQVGLVVDAIVDIATEEPGSREVTDDYQLSGVSVVQGRVTELLDMERTITTVDAEFFTAPDDRSDSYNEIGS